MTSLPKWSNNGLSGLASAMDSTQITLTVLSGTGSRFPGDDFPLRIWNDATFANPIDDPNSEIVLCTSRSGDTLTITRGQEGTVGATHAAGNAVALIVSKNFRDHLNGMIGLVKLDSGTVSAVATLDIVMTAHTAFKNKLLVLTSFQPVSDAVRLLGRVSTNGGSTYDGAAGNYRYAKKQHTSTPASGDAGGTDSAVEIMEAVGNATEACSAEVMMFNTTETTLNPQVVCKAIANGGAPQTILQVMAVERLAAQDTDAFRVLFSAGNISSGKWDLYGWN